MKRKVFCATSRGFVSLLLISLVAVGSPGIGFGAESGTISIRSEPTGAMVYLDGVARGVTPLALADVSEGDHRVTLLKEGFLENIQLVDLKAGEKRAVGVSLTKAEGARYSTSVQASSGGGKSKLPLILGIAGGGAVAAYFLLRNTNEPPTVGGITANPSTGLAGVTSFSFSAQGASDPDDDPLTYDWDFGDGQRGSGATASHVYQNAGTFNVTVTVSDGEESATANTSVTVGSLSGSWSGRLTGQGFSFTFGVDLIQSGTNLSGTFRGLGDTGSINGSVSGSPATARMVVSIPGFQPFTMTGEVSSNLNRIAGTVVGSGFTGEPFTMTR